MKMLQKKTSFALLNHSVLFTMPFQSFFKYKHQKNIHIGNFRQTRRKRLLGERGNISKKWGCIFFAYLCGKVTPGCLLVFSNIILTLLLHYIYFSAFNRNLKTSFKKKNFLIKKKHSEQLKIKHQIPRNILVIL